MGVYGTVFVGDEAVNAEDHKTFSGEEEPAYMRSKTEYTPKDREREAQRVCLYSYKCNSYNLEQPTFTKGYKVTLYSD